MGWALYFRLMQNGRYWRFDAMTQTRCDYKAETGRDFAPGRVVDNLRAVK